MNVPTDTTAKPPNAAVMLAIDALARSEWRRAKTAAHMSHTWGLRIPPVYLATMRDAVLAFRFVWS